MSSRPNNKTRNISNLSNSQAYKQRPTPMHDSSIVEFDNYADDLLNASDEACSSVSLLEPECPPDDETTTCSGPRCEKCQALLASAAVTVCRKCGWYSNLGIFVEIDPDWESATEDNPPAQPTPQTSHVMFWINLVPRHGWVIIASASAVVLESVIARLATQAGSSLRTTWSLGQLTIGLVAAASCHVCNFLSLATEDSDVGVLDIVLRPLRLWVKTFRGLPKRLWFVNTLVCGLVAAIMSPLVIGGIPYERFWDWGFKQPVKQELMGAIMDRARQLDSRNGADDLEGAIGDFAGKGDLTDDLPNTNEPKPPKHNADCVILGYEVDRDGRLSTLLLGSAYRERLTYAGRVSPKLEDDELAKLLAQLSAIRTREPYISIQSDHAIWVAPKVTCRVGYNQQLKDGSLRDIQWNTLMGTMNTGK